MKRSVEEKKTRETINLKGLGKWKGRRGENVKREGRKEERYSISERGGKGERVQRGERNTEVESLKRLGKRWAYRGRS